MLEHKLAFFWAASGFMAGVAITILTTQLWRANERLWAMGAAALMLLMCFGIYSWLGGAALGDKILGAAALVENAPHATGDAEPGSMAEAAARLASKLASGTGSDSDWELLARTYEFLGDAQAARLAAQHQLMPAAELAAGTQTAAHGADPAALLQRYQQLVAVQPDNASAWLGIAELQRNAGRFAAARKAYEKAIEFKAMDANAWADYADVRASLTSLSDTAVTQAIDAALRMNPQQPQALWLQASAAHNEGRYADAVKGWRRLRAALPDDSPDAAVIEVNLAEDLRLSSGAVLIQTGAAPSMAAAAAQVQGIVELDPKLKAQISPGMILFVYAKAADSPAPVAAYRGTVDTWPAHFVLNDSHAMMPARKLSMYPQVKLEARLSRSGQATASAGDLQAEAVTVNTRNGARVVLRIDRVI